MTLRVLARAAFDAALTAADPAQAVHHALTAQPCDASQPLLILSFGKAAVPMARAALATLSHPPKRCIIVTNPENAAPVTGAELHIAGHPVPDAAGLAAAQVVLAAAHECGAQDQVLVLISGGASAMLPCPIAGVSLTDKIALSQLMLAADLDIYAMNLVRQSLSQLKGGGLGRAIYPAKLRSLILSDVPGDDLRVVASGPTMLPIGTVSAAAAVLKSAKLWPDLPASIQRALSRPASKPQPLAPAITQLIGSNSVSVAAARAAIPATFSPIIAPYPLVGPVGDAAKILAALATTTPSDSPVALVTGGETTVHVTGTGTGGRNQDLALRMAIAFEANPPGRDWVFLSGGTDGRDGPTTAAGGFATPTTLAKIRAAGADPAALLANNDSFAALGLADDLLITGATGTNVADIQILLMAASLP